MKTGEYTQTEIVLFFQIDAYIPDLLKQWWPKPYLECLSPDNGDKLQASFLKLFLDEVKKLSNKSKTRWLLDFVRLNIVAHRP